MYKINTIYFYKHLLSFIAFSILSTYSLAGIVQKRLFIKRGLFTTVHKTTFPWIVFNEADTSFNQLNEVISIFENDTLILTVINHDSTKHGFNLKEYTGITAAEINPADSITFTLKFPTQGTYIYYDSYQYPKNRYLGAAGIIAVTKKNASIKKFYWNVKEHQSDFNNKLAQNIPVDWAQYKPDFFTFNGFSYPDILDDTVHTWINGNVGDTIHVFIANTGQSSHSIHFHGYHGKVLYSQHAKQIGWLKDTFPMKSMEGILIEIVPDKPGYYTIHDHNLLTNTGASMHLRGMLSIMTIK
jgi:FtsP/CotA-like multicopper oxidase with cupredoxin domain